MCNTCSDVISWPWLTPLMQWIENISQHASEEVNGEPSNDNACGWGVVAENPDAVDRANSQHASKRAGEWRASTGMNNDS